MIADFFKQSRPIVFLILGILLSLLFYTHVTLNLDTVTNWKGIGLVIFYYLILIVSFVLFELSIKQYEIQKEHSMVSLFFVLLISIIIPDIFEAYELFSFLLLSLGMLRILAFIEGVEKNLSLFEAVVLITSASLLYQPVILCLILILAASLLFSSPKWRYFVIPIFGVSTVVIFVQVFFLIQYNSVADLHFFIPKIENSLERYYSKLNPYLGVFWLISSLVCIYQIIRVKQVRSLYHRRMATFFLVFLGVAFLSFGFESSTLSGLWFLSLWPFCIYLGDFISRLKKRLWLQIFFWSYLTICLSLYGFRILQ